MWAGVGLSPLAGVIDCTCFSEVKTPSPIAVRSDRARFFRAAMVASRSAVGGDSTLVVPAKVTRPTSNPAGRSLTNFVAASAAASSRLGSTSVAFMESDTSIATSTVARSRGTRMSISGRAVASASRAKAKSMATTGVWRRQPGRRGTSRSSIGSEANRTAYWLRRRCWKT